MHCGFRVTALRIFAEIRPRKTRLYDSVVGPQGAESADPRRPKGSTPEARILETVLWALPRRYRCVPKGAFHRSVLSIFSQWVSASAMARSWNFHKCEAA